MPSPVRPDATVSARVGAMIITVAAERGVDVARLMAEAGFEPAWLHDPDARMPLAVESRLWDSAVRHTGDAAFGLHAAAGIRPGTFQVLDYAVRTAPDLGTALERLVRYNRLVHDLARFDIQHVPGAVRIVHRFEHAVQQPCRHAVEFTLASLIVVAAQISAQPVAALGVEFAHTPPEDETAYRAVFGVSPRFGALVSCLVLSDDLLARPIPSADPELSRIVTGHAESLLAEQEILPSLSERVRQELSRGLVHGMHSLERVAGALGMSGRTLQRRLAAESVGFTDLLDDVRRTLALQHIANARLSLGEIAYLLGFSEPSAFHRAFKRWTGMTPRAARQRSG